ncbi:MAG: hypothetical protein V2A66_04960 [Pseudomonadota bacterium]
MKTTPRFLVAISIFIICLAAAGCFSSGSGSGSDGGGTTTHQYLMIPNAVFQSGTPSSAAAATTQKPKVTAPSNTTYTVNQTVTWTVDFSVVTEIEITEIIIEVTDLDGYFVYPLTDAEIAAGEVEIETGLVDTEPTTSQVCNRDYRGNGTCYEQADTGVTNMDFAAASITGDNFSTYTVESATIENIESSDGGASGDTVCSSWTAMCSCSLRACSDGTNSWYDVGSGVYYCSGVGNCTSAAQQAVAYCTRGC